MLKLGNFILKALKRRVSKESFYREAQFDEKGEVGSC